MKSIMTLITILFLATSAFAAEISEADVKTFLNEWLAAQNTGSYSNYAAIYADNFTGIRRTGTSTYNLNRENWLKDRKKMFKKKMVVEATDPEIKLAGTTASVKFEQTWASGTYKDKGDKLLNLALENGKLKITREEMLFSKIMNEPAIAFTSVFTELKKDCKDKFNDVGEGQDMPVICKGYGGYIIDVEFSACCEHMQVQGGKDFLFLFPEQRFVTVMKRKMEWRLANGKPFAVIFPVDKYKWDITVTPNKVSGETLTIKGLEGYENIYHQIDMKRNPNPHKEARRLADHGYTQRY